MKKLVSLILILCLTIGCIYIPASADGNISAAESNFTEADDNKTKNEYVDYISVVYPSPDKHDTTGAVTYSIDIVNKSVYNYIEVSYAATENIVLSRYTGDVIKYGGDTLSLPVSFTVDDLSGEDVILDYHSNIFGQINVTANAYLDGEVVDTVSVEVCVLNTPYGAYVGTTGRSLVFDAYISELHSLSILSDLEYKQAVESLVTLSIEYDPNNYDEAEIEAKRAELRGDNRVFKYYDKASKGLVSKTQAQMNADIAELSTAQINNSSGATVASTTATSNYYTPVVKITRTITMINGSAEQLRVHGKVEWTDIDNATQRIPLRGAHIAIMDNDTFTNQVLGTTYTDNNGNYSVTVTNDLGWLEGGCDIYVEVSTSTENFEVANNAANSIFSSGYYFCTPPIQNVKGNVTASETTDTDPVTEFKAFYVHQALVVGYYYFKAMNGTVPDTTLYYPANTDKAYAYPALSYIDIPDDYFCNWDTILHELGHIAYYNIGNILNFSEQHEITENLITTYGKTLGVQGAWSEGWATYFSIAAQKYYNQNVANITNIVTAGNDSRDFLSISTSSVKIDSYSYNTDSGSGEGNEFAITKFLYKLIYDPNVNLSHASVWNITKISAAATFSDFMTKFYEIVDPSYIDKVGLLLESNGISDRIDIQTVSNSQTSVISSSTPPVLPFIQCMETSGLDYKYKIVFRDKDFNIIYQTGYLYRDDTTAPFELTTSQWSSIVSQVSDEVCYWGIATYQSDSPATGPYYSSLNRIIISENLINTVESTNYTIYVDENRDRWIKFTAPATGRYTFSTSGSVKLRADVFTGVILEDGYKSQSHTANSTDGKNVSFSMNLNLGNTIYIRMSGASITTSGTFNFSVTR